MRQRGSRLQLRVRGRRRPTDRTLAAVRRTVRWLLDLDRDLAPFHALARTHPPIAWAAERGAGRLLRSPTVFEDAVKVLCTVHCTWAGTRAMLRRMVEAAGAPGPSGHQAFPTPQALAAGGERFFREVVRAGFRAPALATLCEEVATGHLDLEGLRRRPVPRAEAARRIAALRGFGPYATELLLRLLGHGDGLALDAWVRRTLQRKLGRRRPPSDASIARRYRRFGPYAGLALWLEVTADWHHPGPRPGGGPGAERDAPGAPPDGAAS